MRRFVLLMTALGAIFLKESFGKPTEVANSDVLDPVALTVNNTTETEATREQRSPQFGLLGGLLGGSDYYDYNDDARNYHYGNKRKYYHHKPFQHHRPHGFVGGHGCRGYGCGGGWQPDYGGHHTGQGASFASASAGSIGGGGPYGGGHSQANAQSASFSVGPFTASFSAAQSSSGQDGF
ncbi:hypothetical protein P5V15_013394 [Pogonomyrmex californicus]